MGGKQTSLGANGMEQSTRECPALIQKFICIPFHPFGPRLVFSPNHSSRKIRRVHSSEVPNQFHGLTIHDRRSSSVGQCDFEKSIYLLRQKSGLAPIYSNRLPFWETRKGQTSCICVSLGDKPPAFVFRLEANLPHLCFPWKQTSCIQIEEMSNFGIILVFSVYGKFK
ncbi:hypothetical protein AVEN_220839-1 [Araneus ventricosus]|uniref:Uncharacterized protein n=1 Tax=Araneus ventricosus TaxID=182803 RepID=A0A4Y2FUJ0_ARAVE|nr:hypothetical protein AVEN_220839-1 [Araneus ventricosus]